MGPSPQASVLKHIIRRFEPRRAAKRLASLQDGGKRLLQYVTDAKVELKDYKVVHFMDLLRKRKPRVVYEFGGGGSTCLIAEILAENEQKFGVRGELHTFEQSKDYYDRMTHAFPKALCPYMTMHLCETTYKRDLGYRVLSYQRPDLGHKQVDFAYIDGPDHIYGTSHFLDYPFHDGDVVELVRNGVRINYAANDVRWFNMGYFEEMLPGYRCTPRPSHKAFTIEPR